MENTRLSLERSDRMPSLGELKSLVVFDVRLENLQTLLSSIVSALNEHSDCLKHLSENAKNSLTHSEFHSALARLSRSIPRATSSKPLSLEDSLSDTIDALSSSLSDMSISLEKSKGKEEALKISILDLEKTLLNKCDTSKLQSTKQKLMKMIDSKLNAYSFADKMSVLKDQIDRVDAQTNVQIETVEKALRDTQQQTASKIKEIEQLVDRKASEQFIWDTLDKTAKTISQQISSTNLHSFNLYNSKLEELQGKLSTFEKDLEKTGEFLRKDMSELEMKIEQQVSRSIESYQGDIQPGLDDIKGKMEMVFELNCGLEAKVKDSVTKDELDKIRSEVQSKAEKSEIQAAVKNYNLSSSNASLSTVDNKEFQIFKDQVQIKLRDIQTDLDKQLGELDITGLRNDVKMQLPDYHSALKSLETKIVSESDKSCAMAKDLHHLIHDVKCLKEAHKDIAYGNFATNRAAASSTCLSCGRAEKTVKLLNTQMFKNYERVDSKGETWRIHNLDRNNSNLDQGVHRTIIKFRPKSAVHKNK